MAFDDPVQQEMGDKVSMDTFINKLIIVKPLEFTDKMKTEFKPDGAEAVFADIALLDPVEGEPWKIFRRVLVMQGYLVGSFKGSVGKPNPLLGTLTYGERKSGQKPPFKFVSLTQNPKVVQRAEEWLAAHGEEFNRRPEPQWNEPDEKRPSTLDSMRDNNPYLTSDEAPF